MVATPRSPRYRAQADPDGVIHVSDDIDDADYNSNDNNSNDESTRGYSPRGKAARGGGARVFDVTNIVDPPDEREMQEQLGRRDPPMDPGAPIYSIKSITSDDGQVVEVIEEGTRSTAQRVIPRDPSLLSNPSIVKSNSSFGGVVEVISHHSSQRQMQQELPQHVPEPHQQNAHEVISVEELEFDERNNTLSPIVPSPITSDDKEAARESWTNSNPVVAARESWTNSNPVVAARESWTNLNPVVAARESWTSSNPIVAALSHTKAVPAVTVVDKQFDDPAVKPIIMSAEDEDEKKVRQEASDMTPIPALNGTPAREDQQQSKASNTIDLLGEAADATIAAEEETRDEAATTLEDTTATDKEEQSGGEWIFSNFMNTLTCQGPAPVDSSSATEGPFGIITCGPSTSNKPELAFPQDDEDANSVLGPKGFGDLDSLPSLEDSIIHRGGGGGVDNDDNVSLSSRMSRVSMQTEYLGNAVESKIKNIEMEKQQVTADENDVPVEENNSEEVLVANDSGAQRMQTELNEGVESFGKYHVRCAHLSSSLSERYTELKAFKKALDLQKSIVSTLSTKLGDHHQDTLDAKIRLGKCQEDAEEYDDSIASFYEVMAMRRSLKGDKDPSTSDALIMISNCLRKKGQYMQAIRELKRALKVYRETLGDSHPSVASTVDEIASLYVTLGDFDKSAAILEEVVKLKAATLGMQNKQVASSLVELATSYECSEDFDRAVKALKKAYKIYTDLDGFSCEEATSTLHRIALIYQASDDIHKAAIAYLGVLRGKKHLLGDDHLEVAETYYRLGVCLRETNQLDKALKCMKEALPILVGQGKNIHDVDMIAEVMHEMALLYKAKRQLAEAAKIFKQELTVRRKIGQPDYPCIAKTLNHLGVTEYEMKMHRRALKHLLEVLTIFQERQEQGIDFAEALYNIGLVFEAVRNNERAYEAFLEAARVFKANGYENDHPHMVKAVNKVKRLATRK